MAKYKVMGIRKREHRPGQPGEPLVPEEIIQAKDEAAAMAEFEKKHFKYKATVCEPVTTAESGPPADQKPEKKEDAKTDSKPTK